MRKKLKRITLKHRESKLIVSFSALNFLFRKLGRIMLLFLHPETDLSVLIAGSWGLQLFLSRDWHYGVTTLAGFIAMIIKYYIMIVGSLFVNIRILGTALRLEFNPGSKDVTVHYHLDTELVTQAPHIPVLLIGENLSQFC